MAEKEIKPKGNPVERKKLFYYTEDIQKLSFPERRVYRLTLSVEYRKKFDHEVYLFRQRARRERERLNRVKKVVSEETLSERKRVRSEYLKNYWLKTKA